MPKTWEARAMLLQCGNDDPGADCVAGWLCAGTLTCLGELNEECLELCVAQAHAGAAPPLCAEIAHEWSALDAAGRRHAGGCLYLLLDAGFVRLASGRASGARQVGDAGAPGYAPWFTVPAAVPLAQAVFTFAWHLARCQASAARLLLGMPAASVQELSRNTLGQVRSLALRHPHWLRPRWTAQPGMWREFLAAAASGDPARLERARLRGQTLLAGETRLCAAGHPGGGRAAPGTPRTSPRVAEAHVRF
jgi:hypothetical protein